MYSIIASLIDSLIHFDNDNHVNPSNSLFSVRKGTIRWIYVFLWDLWIVKYTDYHQQYLYRAHENVDT